MWHYCLPQLSYPNHFFSGFNEFSLNFSQFLFQMPGVTVKDVDQAAVVKAVGEFLKK